MITIAPETGSERLRRVINKGISEEHLQNAATLSAKSGIQTYATLHYDWAANGN